MNNIYGAFTKTYLSLKLKAERISTMVYYVKPLYLQTAYKDYPTATRGTCMCDIEPILNQIIVSIEL